MGSTKWTISPLGFCKSLQFLCQRYCYISPMWGGRGPYPWGGLVVSWVNQSATYMHVACLGLLERGRYACPWPVSRNYKSMWISPGTLQPWGWFSGGFPTGESIWLWISCGWFSGLQLKPFSPWPNGLVGGREVIRGCWCPSLGPTFTWNSLNWPVGYSWEVWDPCGRSHLHGWVWTPWRRHGKSDGTSVFIP